MARHLDSPFLAIDFGNGRLKAAAFDSDYGAAPSSGRASALATVSFDYEELALGWAPWVATLGLPVAAAASSVLGEARRASVLARVQAAVPVPVQLNPLPGLELDVRSPETVGFDRLYAARATHERGLDPALVVDVGTAVTVDAVAAGVFLGGAIAPGPDLLARSLAGPDELYSVTPSPGAPALGKQTRAALEAGVVHTLVGAVLRLAERIPEEAGFAEPELVLTGGGRAYVEGPLRGAGWSPVVAPELVLEGVFHAARDAS